MFVLVLFLCSVALSMADELYHTWIVISRIYYAAKSAILLDVESLRVYIVNGISLC